MKDAISILEQEISWHKNNDIPSLNKDWQEGFLAGLKHILLLFIRIKNDASQQKVDSCTDCGELWGHAPGCFNRFDGR